MPEANAPPDPALQAAALRYAAGDLTPAEAAAFEAKLADDQPARDALAEAVRLSAAALGQEPPAPHRSFRAAIRERLAGWRPGWLARRAYRGHPLLWSGAGAAAVAACTAAGLMLAGEPPHEPTPQTKPLASAPAAAPVPRPAAPAGPDPAPDPHEGESHAAAHVSGCDDHAHSQSVAELWAEWSTPDALEKAHDDEMKWRHKIRDVGAALPVRATVAAEPHQP
jgi:hypothetical protein